RIAQSVHADHIEPAIGRNSQAAALSARVEGRSSMAAQDCSIRADKDTGSFGFRCLLRQEGPIIAVCDETDFLTLFYFVCRQADLLSHRPDLLLSHPSNGKQDLREPRAVEPVQEVALVFLNIFSLVQAKDPGVVRQDANVMSRGDIVGCQRFGRFDQRAEFDPFVAPHAGVRSLTGEVTSDEILNDRRAKTLPNVYDPM